MNLPAAANRIVLDANVIVSALLSPGSPPGLILKKLLCRKEATVLFSRETFAELERVLNYPKIRQRLDVSNERIDEILLLLAEVSDFAVPSGGGRGICRDADDEKYREIAVTGRADVIITGDLDLLVLKTIEDIPIMTPREFMEYLGE